VSPRDLGGRRGPEAVGVTGGLRALLPYYRPYRGTLAAGLALVVLGSVFTLAIPDFLRRGIDAITRGAPLREVWWLGAAIVGAAVLGGLARYGQRELLNGLSRWIEYDLRNVLFRHLERLEQGFFHRTPTGDIMARATNDVAAVRMAAGPAIMYLAETFSRTVMAVPLMVRIDGRLTVIGLAPLALMPVVMVALGRTIHRRFEAVQEHFSTLTTHAHEALSGVRVVRAYRQERSQTRRFADLNEEYVRRNVRLARTFALMFPSVTFLGGLGGVLALWFGSALVIRGQVTLGDYVAFNTYLVILVWPMIALGWVINLFQRAAASMSRIQQILDTAPAVADPPAPRDLPRAAGGRKVEFRGVWYRYPTSAVSGERSAVSGERPTERGWVLEDISFTAEPGQWVAVVGATGAGKTTVAELVPRLMDPDRGEVLLDGVPVRELPLADLRRAIGFVPQETFLFSQTIGENVSMGTDDPLAVAAAARVAQLHEAVEAFPERYETMLGERGVNLSGGQKQRTAIARALARDPDVVILDDALSSVDTHTEAEILKGLKREMAGRTALVVSHRITAIRDADLIVVLERGRVVETGRHEELFERRGVYWKLLRRQQLEEEVEAVG
jgi:ATP-binding cassette, subfamily B, multidrug efflux pump